MNPGNGIETFIFSTYQFGEKSFKLMNPGNGIETFIAVSRKPVISTFKLMNPGNGIETNFINIHRVSVECISFQINESWKRD